MMRFYFNKILRNPVNYLIFFLLIGFTLSPYLFHRDENVVIHMTVGEIEGLEGVLQQPNLSEGDRQQIEQDIAHNKAILEAFENKNYSRALELRYERYHKFVENAKKQNENIEFLYPLILEGEQMREASKYNVNYDSIFAPKSVLSIFMSYVLNSKTIAILVGILILWMTILLTNSSESVLIEKTYPKSFIQHINRKYRATLYFSYGTLGLFWLIVLIFGGLFTFNLGILDYPLVYFDHDYIPQVQTFLNVVVKGVSYQLLGILFLVSFVYCLSYFFKSKLYLFFVSVFIFYSFAFIMPTFPMFNSLQHFNPFIYFRPYEIFTNTLSLGMENPSLNTSMGYLVLALASIVSLLASQIIWRKEN